MVINLRSGVLNFSEERERIALREGRRLGNEISVLNFRASSKRERLIASGVLHYKKDGGARHIF